jgi:glycosyltransferase involved in cell wall biosynthesis
MFGVVVNYFHREGYPQSVQESARLALSLLKNCPEVTSIILADGSSQVNTDFKEYCEALNIKYVHAGKMLSFGEAYNHGAGMLSEDWIVTMASDIYVYPKTFSKFRIFIEENHGHLSIGCLIPYLSRCDLPMQQTSQTAKNYSCYAPIMSFNLNIFPRDVFEKIGGLSTNYTGNFNDIDMSIKLKRMGLDIFLVSTDVHHYGRLTLQHGSNVDGRADWKQFYLDYPELKCNSLPWNLKLDEFLRHPILKMVYRLSSIVPNQALKKNLSLWVYKMIPVLQRVA